MPTPPLGRRQTDTVRNTRSHFHPTHTHSTCPPYTAPTWTPAAKEDQRVEQHPPVHQPEGRPLLTAQVTAGRHCPSVDTTGIDHEDLEEEEEKEELRWLKGVATSLPVSRSHDPP